MATRQVIDLVGDKMGRFSLIADVGSYDFEFDEAGRGIGTRPISETLHERGVRILASDTDAVVVSTADATRVLSDLPTYNLNLLDLRSAAIEVADAWITLQDHSVPVLARNVDSGVFLSSHDDCYLIVESRSEAAGYELCARLVTFVVGTHLLGGPGQIEIQLPSLDLTHDALAADKAFCCSQAKVEVVGSEVRVPFAQEWTRAQDPIPTPTHVLIYGSESGSWTLERLGQKQG